MSMVIKEIWFEKDQLYGKDEAGHVFSQSLLWYPRLKDATAEQRMAYSIGIDGIHWRGLDTSRIPVLPVMKTAQHRQRGLKLKN